MLRYGKNHLHYIIVEHDDHRGQNPIDDDDDENFFISTVPSHSKLFFGRRRFGYFFFFFFWLPAVCAVREGPRRVARSRYIAPTTCRGVGAAAPRVWGTGAA